MGHNRYSFMVVTLILRAKTSL